ncbi:MAG: SDR family oxidoreductase [Polyangiales bacterium]
MRAFITGASGLIGRRVAERLIEEGVSLVLLQREGASEASDATIASISALGETRGVSVSVVRGDVSFRDLGLDENAKKALSGVEHVFHLAAIYDVEASDEALQRANVLGTQNVVDLLESLRFKGRFHFASSTGVAGDFSGTFTESMLNEGQSFSHPYLRSKFEAETLVRASSLDAWVYRPSSVVGDSQTGEINKIDGIYYGFAAMKLAAFALPSWVRAPVPELRGRFNMVPVDYVANAMVTIAFGKSRARVFHLVDPKPPRFMSVVNGLLREFGAPTLFAIPRLPKMGKGSGTGVYLSKLPSVTELRRSLLADFGLPASGIDAMNMRVRFDDTNTRDALSGTELSCPRFFDYHKHLVRYYVDHLDPALNRPARYRAALAGKTVLVTGASRGIGAAAAEMFANAGARVLLVARSADELDKVANTIRAKGGEAITYPTDLSDLGAIDALSKRVLDEHGGVDVLVHNAARSIRRRAMDSRERFHDYQRTMDLNYFSPVRLTLALLESICERGGVISHVLTMGVLIPGPYFGAYLATKAALDAFGDSLNAEVEHRGVTISSVYLPLVKTEMMAPTKEYEGRNDIMTPERAAQMIVDGVVDRRRRVLTPVGRFYSVSNRLTPKTTTRVLNILQRTFPPAGEPSEFPLEKMAIEKAIGGAPI